MDNVTPNETALETNLPLNEEEPAEIRETAAFEEYIEQFAERTRRLHSQIRASFGMMLTGIPLGYLLCSLFPADLRGAVLGFCFLVSGAGFCGLTFSSLSALNSEPAKECRGLLDDCGPPELAPLLARLALFPTDRESELLWQAVSRILNGMPLEELALLPADVRKRLNQCLVRVRHEESIAAGRAEFCGVWLEILHEIGDSRDIAAVNYLTRMSRTAYPNRRIREVAEQCLPRVRARIASQEPGRTLLRASASPPAAPETLLRAAAEPNATAPNELLRPVEPEENSGDSGE